MVGGARREREKEVGFPLVRPALDGGMVLTGGRRWGQMTAGLLLS